MAKVKNTVVKEYIIRNMLRLLQHDKLFTKIYGRNFAENQLIKNIKVVYTNEVNLFKNGQYDLETKELNLFSKKEDEDILSPKKIYMDYSKSFTALHELTHALFTADSEKCNECGVKYMTGIFEIGDEKSCGRGLNEGMTNWFVSRISKMESNSYIQPTNFAYQLELAIGPEKMLKMLRGDITKNISIQLDMEPQETYTFLKKVDNVYQIDVVINEAKNIRNVLQKYQEIDKYESSEQDKIIEDYRNLRQNNFLYKNVASEEQGIEAQIQYFQQFVKDRREELNNVVADVNNTIYNKYFAKEFEEILETGKITKEQFCKYLKLERFGGTTAKLIQTKIAEKVCPENPSSAQYLVEKLARANKLQNIGKYTLTVLQAGEQKITVFKKEGKPQFTLHSDSREEMEASSEIKDTQNIFDFTQEYEEDMNQVIRQFIHLKQHLEKINPNATINIIDRAILIESNGEKANFLIDKGRILPAEILEERQMLDAFYNQDNLPVVKKQNIIKKMFSKIFHREEVRIPQNTDTDFSNKKREFKYQISDLSNYSPIDENNNLLENIEIEKGEERQ